MAGAEDATNVSDEISTTNSEQVAIINSHDVRAKELQRKAKLEAHLKSGCGYGKKKQKLLNAFWAIVWSGLEQSGWRKVSQPSIKIFKIHGQAFCFFGCEVTDAGDFKGTVCNSHLCWLQGSNAAFHRVGRMYVWQKKRHVQILRVFCVFFSTKLARRTKNLFVALLRCWFCSCI